MVQMDILAPFYIRNSSQRNYYIISCLDDCSRKVASKWSERKRSLDVLSVLEEWSDSMFVKAYIETRVHGGINGLTPSEMFLQRLIPFTIRTRTNQQSVTHVGNQKCNLPV
jgi:hypothetical protein